MNKRRLYESIMRNVSKTVKRALRENVSTSKRYYPETKEELKDNIIECLENNLSLNVIDVSGIDDFRYLFSNYDRDKLSKYISDEKIRSIDISEWNINPNAIVDGMFSESTLEEVVLPNTLTKIGKFMFEYCYELTSIIIPNSVTEIDRYAFYACTNMESVIIPNSVTEIGKSAFEGCKALTSITIPNSVEMIDSRAFYACSGLTSVTIPKSVTHISNDAFNEPYFDKSNRNYIRRR